VILTHVRQLTHHQCMATTQRAEATIPALRRRWRLKISMEEAGLTSSAMADELGVSRATITRWFADDEMPIRPAYLKTWADHTLVPYRWLADGVTSDGPDGDGGCARQDSNLRPIAYYATARIARLTAPDRGLDGPSDWTTAQPAAVAITHRSANSVTSICRELDTTCEPAHRDAA
jgi:transcriptional regulator with XRE-family HTH domain